MFPSTSSRETSGLSGKQNKLFPSGPYIKCILFISLKTSKFLEILSRLRHFVPTDTLLSIYRSWDSAPHNLWYCSIGPSSSNKAGQITYLTESALRWIHFAPYRSHAIPSFNQYNILPLNFQYCKSVGIIIHDVSKNSLPANISNLFFHLTQVHSDNTRFS